MARTGGSFVLADLADPGAAERIVAHSVAEHGRLDAVVANAGVGYAGDFLEMAPDRVGEIVDVNVRAPMLVARAGIAAIRTTGRLDATRSGAIVFVSSIAGVVGVPGESVYSASKAAVDAFAECLREELRGDRTPISVSTVVPGVVSTDFLRDRGVPYDRRFPRPMTPERVASVVVGAVESGADRLVEPRWLVVPARLAATTPRLYRALARRFG